MKEIGNILKEERLKSGLTVKQISDILTSKGYKATTTTIYSWENNNSQPTPSAMLEMCEAYGIKDVLKVFGYADPRDEYGYVVPTMPELELLDKYRTIKEQNPTGKEIINYIIEKEYARCTTPATPLEIRDEQAGYTINNVLRIPLPDNRASAGFGAELDSDDITMIKAIANRDTIRADFAVQVDGHSMEPLYSDGDIVLVHRQPAIDVGDIGVFAANDMGYIKKQGDDRLVSINPDYPDVEPEECYGYKCFGQVIGVLDPEWIVG